MLWNFFLPDYRGNSSIRVDASSLAGFIRSIERMGQEGQVAEQDVLDALIRIQADIRCREREGRIQVSSSDLVHHEIDLVMHMARTISGMTAKEVIHYARSLK